MMEIELVPTINNSISLIEIEIKWKHPQHHSVTNRLSFIYSNLFIEESHMSNDLIKRMLEREHKPL